MTGLIIICGIAIATVAYLIASHAYERAAWNARCSEYVEHAVKSYPIGRCHCDGCRSFRKDNGWPP